MDLSNLALTVVESNSGGHEQKLLDWMSRHDTSIVELLQGQERIMAMLQGVGQNGRPCLTTSAPPRNFACNFDASKAEGPHKFPTRPPYPSEQESAQGSPSPNGMSPEEAMKLARTGSLQADAEQPDSNNLGDANMHYIQKLVASKHEQRHFDVFRLLRPRRRDGEEETVLSRVVQSRTYENAGIILVCINAIFIGFQVEYRTKHVGPAPLALEAELVFGTLFLFELLGKVFAYGRFLIIDNRDVLWNVFDIIIVSFMWVEISMELGLLPMSSMSNVSVLRILRVMRLVRVVKIIRTVKFFRELRLMILAISRGSLCLVWVIGVLGTAYYIFGVGITQGSVEFCNPGYDGAAFDEALCIHFGSLGSSILSLYAAMAGGISWIELLWALQPLGAMYMGIFIFYTAFAIFAVVNIITGIFVDSALQSSQRDQDSIIQEQMHEKEEYMNQIHTMFVALDKDKSGTVGCEEFEQLVQNPKMVANFHALGLEISDVQCLFDLLDKGRTGEIDVKEFLGGCLRLKGEAKSLDLAKLQLQSEKLQFQSEWIIGALQDIQHLVQLAHHDAAQSKQNDAGTLQPQKQCKREHCFPLKL